MEVWSDVSVFSCNYQSPRSEMLKLILHLENIFEFRNLWIWLRHEERCHLFCSCPVLCSPAAASSSQDTETAERCYQTCRCDYIQNWWTGESIIHVLLSFFFVNYDSGALVQIQMKMMQYSVMWNCIAAEFSSPYSIILSCRMSWQLLTLSLIQKQNSLST